MRSKAKNIMVVMLLTQQKAEQRDFRHAVLS